MQHVKALVIKAIAICLITWILLTLIFDVAFFDATMVGILITLIIYVAGDLVVLRKIGNVAATVADSGASLLIAYLYLNSMGYDDNLWIMSILTALAIGAFEWFFHKWLLGNVVPDQRSMK